MKMKIFLKETRITPDFLVDVSKNKSKDEIERIAIFSNHPEIQYSGWSFHKSDVHPLSIVTKLLEILLERLDMKTKVVKYTQLANSIGLPVSTVYTTHDPKEIDDATIKELTNVFTTA